MHADLIGALEQVNKAYKAFEHRGKKMSKSEVIKVLKYGISKGYKSTAELNDDEVDELLGWKFCHEANELCKQGCNVICQKSF